MRFIVPLIVGAVVVFLGGTYGAISSGHSDEVLQYLMRNGLFLGMEYTTALTLVRKLAHLTEYAAFGMSTNWALGQRNPVKGRAVAYVLSFSLAMFDEIRQLTLSVRTGSMVDVLIDIAGAVFGIALYELLRPRRYDRC